MKKILWSISSGLVFFCCSLLLSLLFTPYILKHISRADYAIFYLLNNIVVWLGLLRAGQNGGFRYQLSFSIHKKKYISILYSTLIVFYGVLAFVFLIVGVLLYDVIVTWLVIIPSRQEELLPMYIILLINLAISGVSFLFSNILSVYNREYMVNMIRLVLLIIQMLFTLFLLHFNYTLLAMALPLVLNSFLFLIVSVFLLSRTSFKPDFSVQLFSFKILKKSLAIGKWFMLGFLAQLFIKHTDVILIGKMIDLSYVTRFLISTKLYLIAFTITQLIIRIVNPHLIKLYNRDAIEYSNWAALYLKLVVGAAVLMAVVISAGNEYFVSQWVGKEYFIGSEVNSLLGLALVAQVINAVIRSIILAKTELKKIKFNELLEGIINLALSISLGVFWGVKGIVCATSLASLFILLTWLFKSIKPVIGIERPAYWKRQALFFVLFCCTQISGLFFFKHMLFDVWKYLALVVLSVIVFILFYYRDLHRLLKERTNFFL